jgi:hypothetical protein
MMGYPKKGGWRQLPFLLEKKRGKPSGIPSEYPIFAA